MSVPLQYFKVKDPLATDMKESTSTNLQDALSAEKGAERVMDAGEGGDGEALANANEGGVVDGGGAEGAMEDNGDEVVGRVKALRTDGKGNTDCSRGDENSGGDAEKNKKVVSDSGVVCEAGERSGISEAAPGQCKENVRGRKRGRGEEEEDESDTVSGDIVSLPAAKHHKQAGTDLLWEIAFLYYYINLFVCIILCSMDKEAKEVDGEEKESGEGVGKDGGTGMGERRVSEGVEQKGKKKRQRAHHSKKQQLEQNFKGLNLRVMTK